MSTNQAASESISNDKFGLVSFRDKDGTLQFSRDAAGNTTEKLSSLTVNNQVASWVTRGELKNHTGVTGNLTTTGTGAWKATRTY